MVFSNAHMSMPRRFRAGVVYVAYSDSFERDNAPH